MKWSESLIDVLEGVGCLVEDMQTLGKSQLRFITQPLLYPLRIDVESVGLCTLTEIRFTLLFRILDSIHLIDTNKA